MSDLRDSLASALSSRYSLERQIGEGGMATVYLCRDLRHDRAVALKVLKPELAAVVGSERFLAEIRTTAALQHPSILPLFDSGEADGFLYYVMPYVDGESLRAVLDREKQLPVEEAVWIASAVAGALDHAHQKGIVHRDVKPANILLSGGRALVADFGIALAVQQAGDGRLTKTGLSLGTPFYMSPEQATGERQVDGRTDVYSLGCVLYEMLAGQPPHPGPTPQAVLAHVLTGDVAAVTSVRPSTPPQVEWALERALARLPADRFRTAAEFSEALHEGSFDRGPRRASDPSWRAAVAVAAILGVVAAWGWFRPLGAPVASISVTRAVLTLPEDRSLAFAGGRSYPLDLSRDGERLVYVGQEAAGTRLFVRSLDDFSAEGLEGCFSPDGDWMGCFAAGELRRVPVRGGAPVTIAVLSGPSMGADWGTDGTVLYSVVGSGLFRVPSGGGTSEQVSIPAGPTELTASGDATAAISSLSTPRWPHFLPNGTHALVTTDRGTVLLDLAGGDARFLVEGSQARYSPSGHLVYYDGAERIRVVGFDLEALSVRGDPVPAVENVFRGPGGGAACFAVSANGTLIYVRGGFERTMHWVDRNGIETPVAVEPRGYRFPRLSPDGNYVAVTVDPRPSDIWVLDLARGSATRLTTEGHNLDVGWARDGSRLAFSRAGDQYWMAWPDMGRLNQASDGPLNQYHPAWMGEDLLLVHENARETGADLVTIDLRDRTTAAFLVTPANEWQATVSPDGRWVAYASDRSGSFEVYVTPTSLPVTPVLVSVGGGVEPVWAADGTELFYRAGTTIMAVGVRGDSTFAAGRPQALFTVPFDVTQVGNWDVGPDGRFIVVRGDPATTRQFQVVLNWFEELKALES
jgi:serine/threonine-protein kinase